MRLTFTQHPVSLDSDLETPVGMFIRLVGESQGILLESAEVDGRWGRYSIIALDFLLTVSCENGLLSPRVADERLHPLLRHAGKPFLQGLRELMDDLSFEKDAGLPPITRALYGYFGYGAAGMLEPKLAPALPPAEAEVALALPGTLIIFDHGYNRITRITPRLDGRELIPLNGSRAARPPKSEKPSPLAGEAGFTAAVARTRERIRQGEAIQVVLSTPFSAPLSESPFGLYRRLRRINPSPYMFYMRLADTVLLGASPEVLVTCDAGRLRLCPIAGTRKRGHDPAEDALFGDELLQDPKEKAEHVMLVDLGRNDLGRISAPGTVAVERFMEVERFSHVMHLTSRISGQLSPGLDVLDVLAAAFPAGTVSGAPKVRAMEIIAEEERRGRGPYAGAVGWLGLDKDAAHCDFGIIIRSLWVREGQVNWQAGAGIVYDSVPEKEWQECLSKAEVIRSVIFGEEPSF